MVEITPNLAIIEPLISNAYLVGDSDCWVLVDALTPGNERRIVRAAEARFGRGCAPRAIVVTHGHFDHVGSAAGLADRWGVRVHAASAELPYLDGRERYPPLDPSAPGFFSKLSYFFPDSTIQLGHRVESMDEHAPFPGLAGWSAIPTPGHSPGHVSFFHAGQGTLLAGDAVVTMNLDSFFGTLTRRRRLTRPPVPGTINWPQARKSMERLAALRPALIASGHGHPMRGAAGELRSLAEHLPIPEHGRYVREPVPV